MPRRKVQFLLVCLVLTEDRRIALFWDWSCLYQNKGSGRTENQEISFCKGLGFVNVIYSHTKVWSILCTVAYRDVGYHSSGWPFFEWNVAQLIKPSSFSIDLPCALAWIKETSNLSDNNKRVEWMQVRVRDECRRLALHPDTFDNEIVEPRT